MAQKTRLLSHRILKRTGHKRTWADKHDETFLQMIKDSRISLCFAISEDRPALCKTSPSESANVRPSLPMSVQVRHCPSKSANVRPSPPMSVYVRQCPSKSAIVRPSPLMSVQVRQCPSMSANVRPSPPMSVYVRQCPKKHVRCLIESKKDRT